MGVDGPDWQRQITVNTDIVSAPHFDIAAQTIPTIFTKPAYLSDTHIIKTKAYAGISLTAGQTYIVHTETGVGMGICCITKTNSPDIRTQLEFDSVMLLNMSVKGIKNDFNGELPIGGNGFKVLIWDPTTPFYTLSMNLSWYYKWNTDFVAKVYNPTGSTYTVNRIDFYWLEEL